MQSNRIKSIQRRAKRRFLALAIVTTACVGYNALALIAEEDHPIQTPVAKLSTTPGVKAVGIRLVNSNGKSSAPTSDSAATLTSSGPALLVTPSASLPDGLSSPSSKVEASSPLPTLPSVGSTASQSKSPAGFSSLVPPPPPPMSDVLSKSQNGKVVVKLGGSSFTSIPAPSQIGTSQIGTSQIGTTEDLVSSRVTPPSVIGETTKMPPMLFEGSVKATVPDSEHPDGTSASAPIRNSVGEINDTVQSNNRTPQLVKPKSTQITHSVMLAQSTELESPTSESQTSELGPMLEVESISAPRTVLTDSIGSSAKSGKNPKLHVAVTDGVQESYLPQTSPSNTSANAKSKSTESMRRKFDTRISYQSPMATIELECLSATLMDLSSKLCGVAVQDASVCKILHNERSVSLVGNQVGTTLVQVWTEGLGNKPQTVRVNVSQPWGNVQATRSEVIDIKQAIAQNFPRANVSIVSLVDGGIEVNGTTDSEDSARRILELVRKLYLVPVKDKVTVSN